MGRLLGTEDGGVKWLPEVKATPEPARACEYLICPHRVTPQIAATIALNNIHVPQVYRPKSQDN
jgi:hypothetical protein